MSDTNSGHDPDTCGCCGSSSDEPTHENRAGQSALAYRIGTQPTFLRRMLAQLSKEEIPDGDNEGQRPLAELTARTTDDPAIALLDAWAVAADVLTFYQERIANEGYLRTVTERRSLLELARAIGYELNPGVAASTYLAFTVEDADGAPGAATIPSGTQVQSIPAEKGELPQTFETSDDFEGQADWNELRPRLTRPQTLISPVPDATYVFLRGVTTQIEIGDLLLVVLDEGEETAVKRVISLETDPDNDWTRVEIKPDSSESEPEEEVFAAESKTAGELEEGIEFNEGNVSAYIIEQEWNEADLSVFLTLNEWDGDALLTAVESLHEQEASSDDGVFRFKERAGFFGHNAPLWASLPISSRYGETLDDSTVVPAIWGEDWDAADSGAGRSVWTDSQENPYSDADVQLERTVLDVVPDSWAVFEGVTLFTSEHTSLELSFKIQHPYRITEVVEVSLADYGLSAKSTGLTLLKANGDGLENVDDRANFKVRKTTAHVQSEEVELANLPIEDLLPVGLEDLMLNSMTLGLQIGQTIILSGERSDVPGVYQSELLTLEGIVHSGGYTTLEFEDGLTYGYVRDTVTINANVVGASHGETVEEVLGSGDGSQANQSFELKKPPLTYVSATTTTGSESTLELRVNGVEWVETASLYELDATDENYAVRLADDGATTITFGDGETGARLPSGEENITATYRMGIGEDGEVGSDTLSLLKTRPLGVRSVTNLFDASGAADPETLDEAQTKAPLTVLTLDRIVSLQDVEDFARAFAGVGKAKADDLTRGENLIVHLTVAGSDGDTVTTTSELYTNLAAGIDAARDGSHEIQIDSYEPLYFNVSAEILVDSSYVAEDVAAAVEKELKSAFAFEDRELGQTLSAAEVIAVIHRTAGVEAVDLNALYEVTEESSTTPTLASILDAPAAQWNSTGDQIEPARLLMINETGITLETTS